MTTNYERIKNMTVEEMVEYFYKCFECGTCPACTTCETGSCKKDLNKWLQSESGG